MPENHLYFWALPTGGKNITWFPPLLNYFRKKISVTGSLLYPFKFFRNTQMLVNIVCDLTSTHVVIFSLIRLEVGSEMEAVWGRDYIFCYFDMQTCSCDILKEKGKGYFPSGLVVETAGFPCKGPRVPIFSLRTKIAHVKQHSQKWKNKKKRKHRDAEAPVFAWCIGVNLIARV